MARYTGPKNKLSRREGMDLFNKGAKLKKYNIPPGQHGQKGRKKPTEYGLQLRSKQKAKRFYGVLEKQFRNYVAAANQSKGKVGDRLVSLLERRLDNVIYRIGWAPTRSAARQFVSHGHIKVNDKKLNVASYQTKVGDEIKLTDKIKNAPKVTELLDEKNPVIPDWLQRDGDRGKVIREPNIKDLPEPISITDIIEFYSR